MPPANSRTFLTFTSFASPFCLPCWHFLHGLRVWHQRFLVSSRAGKSKCIHSLNTTKQFAGGQSCRGHQIASTEKLLFFVSATETERCPVRFYKSFKAHRPTEANKTNCSFFSGCKQETQTRWLCVVQEYSPSSSEMSCDLFIEALLKATCICIWGVSRNKIFAVTRIAKRAMV